MESHVYLLIHDLIKKMPSSSICHFSGYIDGLGVVEKGLVKVVGVSNYSGNSLGLLSVLKSILCKTMYHLY